MVADPRVRVIAFTGSTRAGRAVGELAGRHLTRAHLELGGNSAFIIRADADVDQAVNLATWGAFLHQGQICMTVGRHIVHESLFDEYVAKLAAKAESMHRRRPGGRPGAPRSAHRRGAARSRAHAGAGCRRPGRRAARGRHVRGALLPSDGAREHPAGCRGVLRRGLRPRGIRRVVLDRRRGRRARRRHRLRAVARHRHARTCSRGLEMARRIPTGIVHINDQTVNDEANAPVRRDRVVGDGLAPRRRAGQHRRVHRDPLDHDAPRAGSVPALSGGRSERRVVGRSVRSTFGRVVGRIFVERVIRARVARARSARGRGEVHAERGWVVEGVVPEG